jgi:hypothetical protein
MSARRASSRAIVGSSSMRFSAVFKPQATKKDRLRRLYRLSTTEGVELSPDQIRLLEIVLQEPTPASAHTLNHRARSSSKPPRQRFLAHGWTDPRALSLGATWLILRQRPRTPTYSPMKSRRPTPILRSVRHRLGEELISDRRVHRDPDGHRVLVEDHVVGVTGRDMIVIAVPFRHDAEEHHASRHAL